MLLLTGLLAALACLMAAAAAHWAGGAIFFSLRSVHIRGPRDKSTGAQRQLTIAKVKVKVKVRAKVKVKVKVRAPN